MVGGVALALVLTGALVVVARSDWARDRLRRQVIERARDGHGLELSVEALDLEPLAGRARLKGVVVQGGDDLPLLEIPETDLTLERRALLGGRISVTRLEIRRPRLRLVLVDGEVANLPEIRRRSPGGRDPSSRSDLPEIRLIDGRISLEISGDDPGPAKVTLEGIDLESGGEHEGSRQIRLDLSGGAIELADQRIPISPAAIRINLGGDRINLGGGSQTNLGSDPGTNLGGDRAPDAGLDLVIGQLHLALAPAEISLDGSHDLEGGLTATLPLAWLAELPVKAPPLGGEATLAIQARRRSGELRAEATLVVRDLTLRPPARHGAPEPEPLELGTLEAAATYINGRLTVTEATLRGLDGASGQVTLRELAVRLRETGRPVTGSLEVSGLDLSRLLRRAGRNPRSLALKLDAAADLTGSLSPLDLEIKGLEVRSQEVTLAAEGAPPSGVKLRLKGELEVTREAAEIRRLEISTERSVLAVSGKLPFDRDRPCRIVLDGVDPGIELSDLGALASRRLGGRLRLAAAIEGSLSQPRAIGNLTVANLRVRELAADRISTGVRLQEGTLSLPGLKIALGTSTRIRVEGAAVELDGTRPKRVRGRAHLEPLDLADAARLARLPERAREIRGELKGTLDLDHDIARSTPNASLSGRLEGVAWGSTRLGQGRVELTYDRGALDLKRLVLRGPGELTVSGRASKSGPLDLRAELSGARVSTLAALAASGEPLAGLDGELDATLHLAGTRDEPRGTGWVRVASLARSGQRLGDSQVAWELTPKALILRGELIDGRIRLDEAVIGTGSPRSLRARGAVRELNLGPFLPINAEDEERREISTRISGGFDLRTSRDRPREATGEVHLTTAEIRRGDLVISARDPLVIRLDRGELTARPLRLILGSPRGSQGAEVRGAEVRLRRVLLGLGGSRPFRVRGTVRVLDPAALAGAERLPEGLDVQLRAAFNLGGDLTDPASFWGRASIRRLALRHGKLRARTDGPVVLRLRGERLELEPAWVVARAEGAKGETSVAIRGWVSRHELDLDLRAVLDLSLLAAQSEEVNRAAGSVRADCRVRGSLAAPTLVGGARLVEGSAELGKGKLPLTDLSARIRFSQKVVLIRELGASLHGGRVTARGRLELAGRRLGQYRIALVAREVDMPLRRGNRALLNARLALESAPDQKSLPVLSGEVEVVRAYLVGRSGPQRRGRKLEQPISVLMARRPGQPRVRLDLRLRDRGDIRMNNNLLDGRLRFYDRWRPFRVVGTDRQIAALGTLVIEPRSTLTLRSTEFEVERGTVEFYDPHQLEGRLDLLARAQKRDWEIRLRATGTLSRPKVRLSSDPPLNDEDIFMLVNIGLTRAEAEQRQRGGYAIEALWRTAGGGKAVKRLFPVLDVFTVTNEYSPRTGRAEPRLKVGRPLNDRTRIDASRGLTLERDFEARLHYELNRIFTLEAVYERDPSNTAGDMGADIRVRYEF